MPRILFTPANARAMAAKSVIARAEAKALAIARANSEPLPANDYAIQRLLRTRKQLDRVDKLLESAKDWKVIKELIDAQIQLAEQERILSDLLYSNDNHGPIRRRSIAPQPLGLDDTAPPAPPIPPTPAPAPDPGTTNGNGIA